MKKGRFRNKETENLFLGVHAKGFPADLAERAQNKLTLVYGADRLESLRYPPGNNLEPLKGSRKGQWSIRINRQWRICFAWHGDQAMDIEVTDYH